jgi:hypothetical protein
MNLPAEVSALVMVKCITGLSRQLHRTVIYSRLRYFDLLSIEVPKHIEDSLKIRVINCDIINLQNITDL